MQRKLKTSKQWQHSSSPTEYTALGFTHHISDDAVQEVISLLPIHVVGEEVEEGSVICDHHWPLVLGASSQSNIVIEGCYRCSIYINIRSNTIIMVYKCTACKRANVNMSST